MSIYGCSGYLLVSLHVLYSFPPQQVSLTVFQQVKKLLLMIWRVGQRWTQGVLLARVCGNVRTTSPKLSS